MIREHALNIACADWILVNTLSHENHQVWPVIPLSTAKFVQEISSTVERIDILRPSL